MKSSHHESWKKKSLVRLAVSVFSTNILVLLINLLTGILIARTFGVEGRGRLVTLQIWPLLITTIFSGGFNAAAVHFSADNIGKNKKFLGGVAIMSLILGILASIVGISITEWKLNIPREEHNLITIAFFLTPLMIFSELTTGMMNGIGRIDIGNKMRLLRVAATMITLVILRFTNTFNLHNVFLATYIPGMLAIFPNLYIFKKLDMLHWGDVPMTFKLWLPYAGAGFIVTLLQTIYLRCDQSLMSIYMGNHALGLYGNAVTFSELLQQVPLAISAIIFTNSSFQEHTEQEKLNSCARLIRVGIFSNIVFGIAGIFLLPHFLYRIYRPEFVDAARYFNLLLPGALAMSIGYPIHTFYLGIKRPWISVIPQSIAVFVTLIGIYFSIRIQSLDMFSLSASAGYVAYCLGMLWYIQRDYGLRAVLSLFPHVGMIRSGWQRVRALAASRGL